MMAGEQEEWNEGPQESEDRMNRIIAEAQAKEEEERKVKAEKERRPLWIEGSDSPQAERGKSIRIRILKERRRIASLYGVEKRGSGNYKFQLFVAKARQKFGTQAPEVSDETGEQEERRKVKGGKRTQRKPPTLRRKTAMNSTC